MKTTAIMEIRMNLKACILLGIFLMPFSKVLALNFTIDGISYSTTSDTEVNITSGSPVSGVLDIPETVTYGGKQYTVTAIAARAFTTNFSITSVHIPGTVKSIGSFAFYDDIYMRKIVIDEGVSRIENDAFGYNGNGLGNSSCTLSLPNSITYIGKQAFQNNGCFNITNLDLPRSLTYLADYAFRNCSYNLKNIAIHENVTSIGYKAFGDLSNLKAVGIVTTDVPGTPNGNPFDNSNPGSATLYTLPSMSEDFKSADYWKSFADFKSNTAFELLADYMSTNEPLIFLNSDTWQVRMYGLQDATIYYTLDGTDPTKASTVYSGPFFYDGSYSVIKAISCCDGYEDSDIKSFTIDKSSLAAPKPVATISSDFKVTIECALPGATIYYCYGQFSGYSESSMISRSTVYSGPFTLAYGSYLSMEAVASGYSNSGWVKYDFYTDYYVTTPFILGSLAEDNSSYTITIDYHPSDTYYGEGAYYTLDGSDPSTSATRFTYTEPFMVDRNCTVRAVAYREGRPNSQIAEYAVSGVDSQFKVDGIYYNKAANTIGNYAEVTYGALAYTGDVVIPETVEHSGVTYTVVSIGGHAFDANQSGSSISSISLPSTIETIGDYAFYCNSLNSIVLPAGVKSIGKYGFGYCQSLKYIALGSSLEEIGNYAFNTCNSLTGISFPETLSIIGSNAFQYCHSLSELSLPSSLKTIQNNAFYNCNGLKKVKLNEGIETIGGFAFKCCYGLTEINIPEGVIDIGEEAFYNCSSLLELSLPSSLKIIQNSAFYGCSGITNLQLGEGLISIGNSAFYNCNGLKDLTVPESVSSIGESAFQGCTGLVSVKFPSQLKYLPQNLFANCYSLLNVKLPDVLESLGFGMFQNCNSLTSVAIPEGVTEIPGYFFKNCSKLVSVSLPSTLQKINAYVFNSCSSLCTIQLPASLSAIYEYAFVGCDALQSIYLFALDPPTLADNVFKSVLEHARLYVDQSVVSVYQKAKIWQDFVSVDAIGELPCSQPTFYLDNNTLTMSSLTDGAKIYYTLDGSDPGSSETRIAYTEPLTLHRTLTVKAMAELDGKSNSAISEASFSCDYKFKSGDLWYSFTANTNAPEVIVVRPDGDDMYSGSIVVPSTVSIDNLDDVSGTECAVVELSERLFQNNIEITSVTLPSALRVIPGYAFSGCTSLTTVNIPGSVTTIGSYAFQNCSSLVGTLTLPENLTEVGDYAFYTTGYTSLVIEPSKTAEEYDFKNISVNVAGGTNKKEKRVFLVDAGETLSFDYSCKINGGRCYFRIYIDDELVVETNRDTESSFSKTYDRQGSHTLRVQNDWFSWSNNSGNGIDYSVTNVSGVKEVQSCNIGDYAFYGAPFKTIDIRRLDVSIYSSAFESCRSIESVSLDTRTVGSWFSNKSLLKNVSFGTHVKSIGDNAFNNCAILESITLGDNITSLGNSSFRSCLKLNSVSFGSGLTSIGESAFYDCDALDSVSLGDNITSIGDMAFYDCNALESISLGDNITSIGTQAFYSCDKLKSVSFGNNLKFIGNSAFQSNMALTSIHIPGSVQTIGESAFYDCYHMESIVIDEGVERIGSSAFGYNGNWLTGSVCTISLPNSITHIGNYAFQNNAKFDIKTLDLPESLTYIGIGAFRNCSSNLRKIFIHDKVDSIGYNAFGSLGNLEMVGVSADKVPVMFGNDASNVDAFNGSQSKATLYVQPSLLETYKASDYWKSFAGFESCLDPIISIDSDTWLVSIYCIKSGSVIYYTTDGSTPTNESTVYTGPFYFDGSYNEIKAIAICDGYSDSNVKSLTLNNIAAPKPVSTISPDFKVTIECELPGATIYYYPGDFYWSWNEEQKISNSKVYDGPFTLLYAQYINIEAVAPGYENSGWVKYDYYTDYYVETPSISVKMATDKGSDTITIDYHPKEDGYTYYGEGAYYTIDGSDPSTSATRFTYTEPFIIDRNCTVRAVAYREGRPNSQIAEYAVSGVDSQFKVDGIYYNKAANTIGNYAEVTYGALAYTGDVVIPETVEHSGVTYTVVSIGGHAFDANQSGSSISSISLPSTIETIGDYAFYCNSLNSIVLPAGVKSIGIYGFGYCQSLKYIDLGSTLVNIAGSAFYSCCNLMTVNLCEGLESIGESTFYNCYSLSEINIPESVKSIGAYAFYGCTGLVSVKLPSQLKYLPSAVFSGCNSLLSIKLPESLESFEYGIFQNCSSLTSIAVPDGVKEIPAYCFSGCSALTSVSLPSMLQKINDCAFNSCSSLGTIQLPASLEAIGQNAFLNCTTLRSIYLFALNPPTLADNEFQTVLEKARLYVEESVVSVYKDTKVWQDFAQVNAIDNYPCAQPVFYMFDYKLTISCTTPDAVVYYTTDSSNPATSANRSEYSDTIDYNNGGTVYAIATKEGMDDSGLSLFSHTFTVSDPVISLDGLTMTITSASPGAEIYYLVRKTRFNEDQSWYYNSDGSFYGYEDSSMFAEFHKYDGPVNLPYSGTIYAIAKHDGWTSSRCMYLEARGEGLVLSTPTITGDKTTHQISITSTNDAAYIFYTLNGEDPNYAASRNLYKGPFTIDKNYTVNAVAAKKGYLNSSVATVSFNWFRATAPVINIDVHPDLNKVFAVITCDGEYDSIHYTIKSTSVNVNSPVYKGPVELTGSTATIRAMAVHNGWLSGYSNSFNYKRSAYTCITPTFTENKTDSTLTITSSDSASIYYTTDGTAPSRGSILYTGPIKIERNDTVKAIAYRDDLLNSDVGQKIITWVQLHEPKVAFNGNMCTITCDKPESAIMYALSDDPKNDTHLDYVIYTGPFRMPRKETYVVAYATLNKCIDSEKVQKKFSPDQDACCSMPQIFRDGSTDYIIMNSATDDAVIRYTVNGLDPDSKSAIYTEPVLMTSNATVRAYASADSYYDSDINSFTVDWFTVPQPEIHVEANHAIITCSRHDATIYYTLDGTDPTVTSDVYNEPILLKDNSEIRAMAVLKDWNNSGIAVFTPNVFYCDSVKFEYDGLYLSMASNEGSTIYYTLDGSNPSETSTVYSGPVEISQIGTVKAFSTKHKYVSSSVIAFDVRYMFDGLTATLSEAGLIQELFEVVGSTQGLAAISVNGTINHDDLDYIVSIKSLEHIDMSNTSIDGGIPDEAFEGMKLISFIFPKNHFEVGNHIFKGCPALAAVVWNVNESVPETLLSDVTNPNLLLYVNANTYSPKNYIGNLVSGGQATEIKLVDVETGGNFYCPQRFYARKISYTRNFEQPTEVGVAQGWETLSLPFDVTTITHESKGKLAPFAKRLDIAEYKPFWLCEFSATGFNDAAEIKAYTPYIISMPNSLSYADDYILSGKVTFASEGVYVEADQSESVTKGSVTFTPTMRRRNANLNIMNINLTDCYDSDGEFHRSGSAFISGLRESRPFEAYAVIGTSRTSMRIESMMDGFATSIIKTYADELLRSAKGVYDLSGRKLQTEDIDCIRIQGNTQKVLIIDGKKVLLDNLGGSK